MTLLIMAAGMGSRYGGIKQIEPVGACKELIIDYSIYDAVLAGFSKVVFVIRRDIEDEFCNKIYDRIKFHVDAEKVFQDLNDLPSGFTPPAGRTKPWGTTQAILAARHMIDEPFCIVNADDFYGREAFEKMSQFLGAMQPQPGNVLPYKTAMVGYKLRNTISDVGSVSRGVAEVNGNGMVKEINERLNVEKRGNRFGYVINDSFFEIDADHDVAVNFFGFGPEIMPLLHEKFAIFLQSNIDNLKAEYQVPIALNELIHEGRITMKMMTVSDRWLGFTYPKDKDKVTAEITNLVNANVYPTPLWAGTMPVDLPSLQSLHRWKDATI